MQHVRLSDLIAFIRHMTIPNSIQVVSGTHTHTRAHYLTYFVHGMRHEKTALSR